jgi:hypothetical protein
MASAPFERMLSELQKIAPSVKGEAGPEWGARQPGSRVTIRRSLAYAFMDWSASDLTALANLDEPPRPKDRSVSISHTHDLGGWMTVGRPLQIGWDVELKDRIKAHIVERVCSPDELKHAPEAAFLWCAKESYFKALEDEQPTAIPQLTIGEWAVHGPQMWRWRGIGPRNGEGLLIDAGTWLMAGVVIL